MFVIVSDGSDGVICAGPVGSTEKDSVRGAVGLRQVQDLRSTWSCSGTDGLRL